MLENAKLHCQKGQGMYAIRGLAFSSNIIIGTTRNPYVHDITGNGKLFWRVLWSRVPMGFLKDSLRAPSGLLKESFRKPAGLLEDSLKLSWGFLEDSLNFRNPQGFLENCIIQNSFRRIPQGFLEDSLRSFLKDSSRNPQRILKDCKRDPWGFLNGPCGFLKVSKEILQDP